MPEPVPFPSRPGAQPVEPPPMQPAPTAPEPIPADNEDPPRPELPAAASSDPFGLVRLAVLNAEHAELVRILSIDGAAEAIEAMANAIAFGPSATFSRSDVTALLRSAARKVRGFRDPRAVQPA